MYATSNFFFFLYWIPAKPDKKWTSAGYAMSRDICTVGQRRNPNLVRRIMHEICHVMSKYREDGPAPYWSAESHGLKVMHQSALPGVDVMGLTNRILHHLTGS